MPNYFDPDKMKERVEKLRREGKLPALEEFLKAFREASGKGSAEPQEESNLSEEAE